MTSQTTYCGTVKMAAHMSKEEYLKRYLSSAVPSSGQIKKRRKKKKPVNEKIAPRSRIVDDDVDFNSLLPENLSNTLDDDIGDNDPTVAEVIDERPEHIKRIENYRKDDRWKVLGQSDDEDEYGIVKDENHSDASPPRRRQRYDSDSDPSPPRNARMCSDSDQSPPRRKKHNSDSDQSPPRKKRNDSDSDQSPPRKKRNRSDSDQSPPRRKPCESDSDQSPPRRKRNDSDSDQSPVRRKKDSKVKSRMRDSESVNRKPSKKHSRNSDSSRKHDSDEEIPRKKMKTDAKPTQTLGGAKAGLSSAKEMRLEAEKMKKKEEESFKKIGDDRLGRNAETVFRDKSGKRRNLKEEQAKQSEEDAKKAEEMEKYKKWGQGLKQREDQQKSLSQALHEASKPLARYKDDDDLDKHLRDMERAEDPMLAFIKKKKAKHNTKPEKPRYKGPMPPPNRFSIMPGYRWDGVNRSNGFEAQIFAKASEQKATKSMAYKWSVEEM